MTQHDCPAILDLVRDGRVDGKTFCRLPAGHDGEHHAKWIETTGDKREVDFYDPDRVAYDVASRGFIVNKPAGAGSVKELPPTRSKSQATRAAVQTSAPSPVTSVGTLMQIALEDLHESAFNKRRTWGNLDELAASIREVGVLEPLCARTNAKGYELVFGHRRFRAATKAGIATVPVMVRVLTDEQAMEIQAIENLQRTDLHPIEEAEGFEQLQKIGWSAEDIAAKLGKSRSYVFGRLKLLELGPEGRKIFAKNEINASVALGLARVPESMQEKAIELLRKEAGSWQRGGPDGSLAELPVRDALDLLREHYTLRLAIAPFDRKDPNLLPGIPTCDACPKRTGNQRDLFGDVDGKDESCTDPICFDKKRSAHAGRQAAKLQQKGVEVLKGRPTRFGDVAAPRGFVKADEWVAGKKVGELLEKVRAKGKLEDKTVMIGGNGKAVEIVDKKELIKAAGVKEPGARSSGSTFDHAAYMAKQQLERKVQDAVLEALVAQVEAEGSLSLDVLRMVVHETAQVVGFALARRKADKRKEAHKGIAKATEAELAGMLVELTFAEANGKDLETACKRLGVNAKAIEKRVRDETKAAEDAKASAKPAGKPAKKKGRR